MPRLCGYCVSLAMLHWSPKLALEVSDMYTLRRMLRMGSAALAIAAIAASGGAYAADPVTKDEAVAW
jgi:hypothetical protein